MDDRERIFDFIEQDDPRAAIAVGGNAVALSGRPSAGGRGGSPRYPQRWPESSAAVRAIAMC